jgi:precorrin-6B methylase 2
MAYESIAAHRAMALDAVRNDAYARALAAVVGPDSVVLDLGAGTGVLGLIAARLGAKRVYLVEPSDVIAVAEEIVQANGLQDRVRCLHGRLDDITLPERADVLVSVMTGNFLLTEDLLPVLFDARDRHLKQGGYLIPGGAEMEAVLVSAPEVHATQVESWSTPQHGVDLGVCRSYAANTVMYGPAGIRDALFLARPATLLSLDLYTASYEPLHAQVTFEVTQSGVCHGLAGWFRMRLGDSWLSTSPQAPRMHWSPVFLPIDPPMSVETGQQVTLALDRLRAGAESRRHSTLLSSSITAQTLQKASTQYVPSLTPDLSATAFVLSCVDGALDVTGIAERVQSQFPGRYRRRQDALEFVQRVVSRFEAAS